VISNRPVRFRLVRGVESQFRRRCSTLQPWTLGSFSAMIYTVRVGGCHGCGQWLKRLERYEATFRDDDIEALKLAG
jgi:hypothetical protein